MTIRSILLIWILLVCRAIARDTITQCSSTGDIYIEQCCKSSLVDCFQRKSPCAIAVHLESFRQWLLTRDVQCAEIGDAVARRYHLFEDTLRYTIDRDGFEIVGDILAPIQVVMYISMTCSLCKRLYDELLDTLINTKMGEHVNVIAKPFTTKEVDRIFTATFGWKKQSSLLRAIRPIKERITTDVVLKVTDSLGIPRDALLRKSNSMEVINLVEKSRTEGIKNGVSVTPAFFINNVQYNSYKDIRWVIDYISFHLEKLQVSGSKLKE